MFRYLWKILGVGDSSAFRHPGAFWLGTLGVLAGVIMHIPMFLMGAATNYRLVGMPMDAAMKWGMFLICAGLPLSFYGMVPKKVPSIDETHRLQVRAMDDAPIRGAHIALLVVISVAVVIDTLKPATLGLVMPGMIKEYGLRGPGNPHAQVPVALLAFYGISGTMIGSFVWGWLGDVIGRRASILLAAETFIGTSICGAMPAYQWNFFMCFVMGLGAGGMLPITFTLIAETIPARQRSWLMVLVGGNAAVGYLMAVWLAKWLEPHYGWRALWFPGAPTGLLLMLLNHWIPESPRFLLVTGRTAQAREVMQQFGVRVVEAAEEVVDVAHNKTDRFIELLRAPFGGLTVGLVLYGLAYGLVTFGFLLWLPANLRLAGMSVSGSDSLLKNSAVIGLPATIIVAALYGWWSSKRTMVALGILTAVVLAVWAVMGKNVASHTLLLEALIVLLLVGSNAMIATLTPYSSEVYPTKVRSRGTGLATGASKAGGVLGIGLVCAAVAPTSIAGSAVLGLVPTLLAAIAMVMFGVETRRMKLEEITAATLVGSAKKQFST
ncbi:MAG TPA: MFS transporter [Armatimonadota bacterium]|nr:MFS transporter [Armatimonadota bacterium]